MYVAWCWTGTYCGLWGDRQREVTIDGQHPGAPSSVRKLMLHLWAAAAVRKPSALSRSVRASTKAARDAMLRAAAE